MTQPAARTVLIADSMPLVARALASLLSERHGLAAMCCASEAEAMAAFERAALSATAPGYALLFIDPDIAGSYGLSLLRWFAARGAAGRCVLLAGAERAAWIAQARELGALGCLLRDAPLDTLEGALARLVRGQAHFPEAAGRAATRLTRRQQDIVGLLHRGYTSKRIASQLSLTPGTVDNHVTGLMRALNASSRSHAVARAVELGYVTHRDLPRSQRV